MLGTAFQKLAERFWIQACARMPNITLTLNHPKRIKWGHTIGLVRWYNGATALRQETPGAVDFSWGLSSVPTKRQWSGSNACRFQHHCVLQKNCPNVSCVFNCCLSTIMASTRKKKSQCTMSHDLHNWKIHGAYKQRRHKCHFYYIYNSKCTFFKPLLIFCYHRKKKKRLGTVQAADRITFSHTSYKCAAVTPVSVSRHIIKKAPV